MTPFVSDKTCRFRYTGPEDILQMVACLSADPLHRILEELLTVLDLPTHFDHVGVTQDQLEGTIKPALQHPLLTKFNLRPIRSEADVRDILGYAMCQASIPFEKEM